MTGQTAPQHFIAHGMDVRVYANGDALGAAAAAFVASTIRAALARDGEASVMFATAASQHAFQAALIRETGVDWGRVTAFHLDEYLGLPDTHPASFRKALREHLLDRLPFGATHLLAGDAPDPQAEARRYGDLLRGRRVALACIGIGENAHIAFNDPPADFAAPDPVHLVELDEACRRQQVGEGAFPTFDDVPRRALSVSIPGILRAERVACIVPDERKAAAVRCTLEGRLSPDCPASALRTHRDCHLFLDAASASALAPATLAGGA